MLTCDDYPQLMSVEMMKLNGWQGWCNRWEKGEEDADGRFWLWFVYARALDKHQVSFSLKDGDKLYLQNSGHMDIVGVDVKPMFCRLKEVAGYPNVYAWVHEGKCAETKECVFALHIRDGRLSDMDVSDELEEKKSSCVMMFVNEV